MNGGVDAVRSRVFAATEMALGRKVVIKEGRAGEALAEFREGAPLGCPACRMPRLGRAFDLQGNSDSTIAMFEGYLASHSSAHNTLDEVFRAGIYKRLGELYEARGDRERAIANYTAFISYWKSADPELQPKVAQVQQRMVHLRSSERR